MRKFVVTTALALVLAGGAYAQGHHGGGGGGGGVAAHGGGGGGPGPSFSAQRGPSGPSMGNRGPTANVYNRAPTTNAYNGGNHSRFTERNRGQLYNRYEGENRNRFENREGNRVENGNRFANREGNRVENGNRVEHGIRVGKANLGNFRHGIVRGNFFEHGRHFGFRRFWNDQWVFLTAWDSCTAWAWVNVAPGAWVWTPIDICIG